MKKNVGNLDKAIRIIIAIILGILIFTGKVSGTLAWILGIISVVLLIQALSAGALFMHCLVFPQ